MRNVYVQTRPGNPEDAAAILRLKCTTLWERMQGGELPVIPADLDVELPTARNVGKLASELQTNMPRYHVAVVGGDIVGMYWLSYRNTERRFQFRRFYVHPRWQGRGVGSGLMDHAKQRAQNSTFNPAGLYLYTGAYNLGAIAKYKHWGFTQCSSKVSVFTRIADRETSAIVEWVRMNFDF